MVREVPVSVTVRPIDPSRCINNGQLTEVGRCITLDCYGDYLHGRVIVRHGIDLDDYTSVYSLEVLTYDGLSEVITRGKWHRSFMQAWMDCEDFLADPSKIVIRW